MSRVITFSRYFPATHPKKGQPTYFVEKVLNSVDKHNYWFGTCDKCGWSGSANAMEGGGQIADTGDYDDCVCPKCYSMDITELNDLVSEEYYLGKFQPKHHTIRAGNRWKVGDKFSPRVWSGKPYSSKQIIIAPDIEIKKVWDIRITFSSNQIYIEKPIDKTSGFLIPVGTVAENDGLSYQDFSDWFKIHPKKQTEGFTGQIICWNESIEY